MLVSLREISKYVDISSLTPEEIANKFTFSGIEVENIKKSAEATNLIIGQVISCVTHPDSDHLHICKVDIGSQVLNIVCGAPNVREGLKVIVAQVGAKLKDKEILKTTLKGVESEGMLCALNELGVDEKYLKPEQISGIEELGDDAVVGNTKVLEYLGLDDTILDLSLLANRSDCYALFNVVREIGALFSLPVNIPEAKEDSTYVEKDFKVGSESTNCKEFALKIVKGIEIKESPKWLKDCLNSEGIKSINNIVDLGNYIMLLTGQPLHMYDLDALNGKDLTVKDNFDCEFNTLDEKTYHIKNGDLVVTSNNEIVCVGGVLGGLNSEVTSNTKNIAIEAANFNHAQIRKTATRFGLSSDSSQRFIKGINKDQADFVLNLTTNILKDLTSYKEISNILKYDELNHDQKVIECSKDYINNRLGTSFSYEEIKETLTKLYFEIVDVDDNNFKAAVPNFRIDIDGKADLSEEVIRYLGIDNIVTILPSTDMTVGKLKNEEVKTRKVEDFLISSGLHQILSYSLISKDEVNSFNYLNKEEGYKISNPITEEHEYVRLSLLPSMLKTVTYNLNHQQSNFGLFEVSNIDTKKSIRKHLSVALVGKKYGIDHIEEREYDYYDLKGIVDNLLASFNIAESRVKVERLKENEEFHPYRSALISLDGRPFTVLGELHPLKRKELGLGKVACLVMECDLSLLFVTKTKNNKFEPISVYPSSSRDYAFIVSKDIKFSDLKREIKKQSNIIKNVNVFDIYEGEHIKEGHVSLAIRITFEAKDHTLKDNEIVPIDLKIREILVSKFKTEIRQ